MGRVYARLGQFDRARSIFSAVLKQPINYRLNPADTTGLNLFEEELVALFPDKKNETKPTVIPTTVSGIPAQSAVGHFNQPTIAVLYFENNTREENEWTYLEKGLISVMISELQKIEALRIVERTRLQQLMDEIGLATTDKVDNFTAQRVGNLLGAQTLLLGSFMTLPGGEMLIDARIVETESGRILKADYVTGEANSLTKMVNKLVKKIAKDLVINISIEDERRLRQAGKESFQAILVYSKALNHEDEGEYDKALELYRKILEIDPQYDKAKARIEALDHQKTKL